MVSQPSIRELFEAHHDYVWRCARRLGAPASDIDDVVQETFIIAGRKLGEFEGRAALTTWLFAIVMRVVHTHRRTAARRNARARAVAGATMDALDPYSTVEAVEMVDRLLSGLDPAHREAIVRTDLEGQTAVEAASELGVNINTMYSRIREARHRLQVAVERLEAGERVSTPADRYRRWAVILAALGTPALAARTASAASATSVISVAGSKFFVVGALAAVAVGIALPAVESAPRAMSPMAATVRPPFAPRARKYTTPGGVSPVAATIRPSLAPSEQDAMLPTRAALPAVRPDEPAAKASVKRAREPEPEPEPERDRAAGLREEITLIETAEAALRSGDSVAALRYARRHERDFPTGSLAPERLDLTATIHCRLGDPARGRAILAENRRRWPQAPVSVRATQECSGSQFEPSVGTKPP